MSYLRCCLVVAFAACQSVKPAPTASSTAGASPDFASSTRSIEAGDVPKTSAVVVMHRGRVIHEAYFDGATAETRHDLRSVGKSITSLAIGIAIDRELVTLQTPVFSHFGDLKPANPSPSKDAVTVEDFLTMSSALDCDDDDDDSIGNELNMYPLRDWTRWAVDLPARADYRRDATGRGPWRYCTAGTVLLGRLIERVAQQSADAFIAEHIFDPLGITDWEFARSPSNEVMTGGMIRLRARDFAMIGEMVRNGGRHGDRQVVPRAYVEAALTVRRNAFPSQDYGYLFWHRTFTTSCGHYPAWFASGNGGNLIAIIAKLDAVVVIARRHYNQRGVHDETKKLVEDHIIPPLSDLGRGSASACQRENRARHR